MLNNFLIIAVFVLYTVIVFHLGSLYILWQVVSHPDRKELDRKINELRELVEEMGSDLKC